MREETCLNCECPLEGAGIKSRYFRGYFCSRSCQRELDGSYEDHMREEAFEARREEFRHSEL